MKHLVRAMGFGILIMAVLSCSLAGKLAKKGLDKTLNTKRADSLWSDVPRMDGLNDSLDDDLPITVKLAMHTFVNLVLKGMQNQDDPNKHISTDWIMFKYKGNGAEIEDFYTPEKMKSAGNWSLVSNMKSGCMDSTDKGIPGSVCLYQKTEDGLQKGIIIISMQNKDNDPQVPGFVYFIRAETEADDPQQKTGQ